MAAQSQSAADGRLYRRCHARIEGNGRRADLAFLTYLLDMVVHEAMQQSELPRRRRTDPQ
jgi:hypothetical protein